MKIPRLFKGKRRGAAAVEVAVILPILVILSFGAIKYGWLFYRLQQITNVTRQAARLAIRPSSNNAIVTAEIDRLMGLVDLAGKYTVTELNSGAATQSQVTVAIEVDTDDVDIVKMKTFLPTPEKLSAKVTMSKEGP